MNVAAATGLAAATLHASPALAQPAGAADASMVAFYSGTLQIEVPNQYDPYFAERQFAPDHTYVDLEKGQLFHGTWSIENGKICTLRQGAKPYCNLGLDHKIGDTWQDRDPVTGNEVDFTLVAGRQPLK